MTAAPTITTPLLWSAVLGLAAALGSYGLACVFPFAALAALAAVTLPTRQAVALMAAVWAVNQIVGFTILGYATGDHATTWGLIIGAAAFLALGAAKSVTDYRLVSIHSVAALVMAIAAYQIVMFAGAWALDGFASSTLEIVATVALNDVCWYAGLAALRLALGASLPRWFAARQPA